MNINPSKLNFGNRLYENGIKKIEDVQRKYKESQLMREIEEYKDLTFHPKINDVSQYFGAPNHLKPEENLIQKGILAKDKIDQMRAEVMYTDQKSCSFHPKINNNSRKIANQRQRFFEDEIVADERTESVGRSKPNQHLQLYDDAMKRVERHNKIYSMCIDSECTFKPDTVKTRYRYKNSKPRYNVKSEVWDKPSIERFNQDNFDQVTGQPLFHPKIGRSPINKNRKNSKSIGDLLYETAKVYEDRKESKRQQQNMAKREMYRNKSSEILLEK